MADGGRQVDLSREVLGDRLWTRVRTGVAERTVEALDRRYVGLVHRCSRSPYRASTTARVHPEDASRVSYSSRNRSWRTSAGREEPGVPACRTTRSCPVVYGDSLNPPHRPGPLVAHVGCSTGSFWGSPWWTSHSRRGHGRTYSHGDAVTSTRTPPTSSSSFPVSPHRSGGSPTGGDNR